MRSIPRLALATAVAGALALSHASAQINFVKSGYYLALGDSVSAGEGAMPVTHGFVYQLYDRGVFGQKQELDFANIAVKGATTAMVQQFQVPQALCNRPPRIQVAPSVVTLTVGANDFFDYIAVNGIPDNPFTAIPQVADEIAKNVETIIRSLVFGVPSPPAGQECAALGLEPVTILVFNYYSFDHPDPAINFVLNLALQSFSASLQARTAQIQADAQAAGRSAKIGFVDTFSATAGRSGLLLIEKRNGFTSPFDFEIHPTNAGHSVIAREFERVWNALQ